jgi:nucleoid-associated protein YgaU
MVDTVIPPQGTPGVFDPRNPTLLPNFDKPNYSSNAQTDPNGSGAGALGLASPLGFLNANPRGEATCTATIGGTVTAADILTIEASNPVFPSGFISHTYTVQAGDTLNDIAEELASLFDDDPAAANVGLRTDVLDGVITFRQAGPVGNFSVLTAPSEAAVKITIAGTALTGDQITALFTSPNLPGGSVAITQAVTTSQSATTIAGNLVTAIGANAALVAAGITASNVAGVITLVIPAADEPVVVSTWVNSNPLTAVIGGTVAAGGGDVLNLIFTGAGIPGSPVTVSYTTVAGDTTATIAAALGAAVNSTPALQDAAIEASVTSSTISFTLGPNIGQMRLTESVTTGSETITVTTAPTTTSVLSTGATETITFSNTNASVIATIVSSAPAATDTVALTFTNAGVSGLPVTKTYTLVGADSATTIAAGLVALINADTTLSAANIRASNMAGVITITEPGVIGNSTVVSATITETGGGTETCTFTPSNGHMGGGTGSTTSGTLSGGTGPIIAANNFEFALGNSQVQAFFYGQPYVLGYDVVTAMVDQGMPIL